MALFKNLFKSQPPAPGAMQTTVPQAPKIPAPQVPPVPAQLPKISSPTAAGIAQHSNPGPQAQKILAANPKQTPAQYLQGLQDQHQGTDMVNTLAHGMSDRDGVHWASQSAEKVADKLPPQEVQAMKAAQTWAKNPTPANQAAAGKAAQAGGSRGPGSLAAQGAAWAKPVAPEASGAVSTVSGLAAAPRLTPHAVSGSVLMSSAIKANPALAVPAMSVPALKAPAKPAVPATQTPKLTAPTTPTTPTVPPAVQAHTFQQQHPFIKMGIDIASGKTPV